jgi:cell division protein FtsB
MGRSSWTNFLSSRWFMSLAVFALLALGVAYSRAFYQNYHIQEEIKRLQSEAERLESKRLETLDLLNYVKSPAYVEEKARTELNMVKEGEQMAIVNTKVGSAKTSRQSSSPVLQSSRLDNPLKWWNYFFH